ncbi:MAG: nucleoside diphosphate kinase regulator [Aquimonas sp.]|nr:nucleoside diphosphate kinase regulator [Aquimonas sp.]
MSTRPDLIVSSLDFDRLDAMIAALSQAQASAGAALAAELARARVVEPAELPPDRVSMRSTVRFMSTHEHHPSRLTLVYPHELGSEADQISVLAPVGTALLGLRAGDSIDWPLPGGDITRLSILGIDYQPEREGQVHR